MSTYLVTRRINEDRVYMPGETVVDPPWAAILMERGYLIPVPDNFVPPTAAVEPAEDRSPKSARSSKSKAKAESEPEPELPKTIDLSEVEAVEATPDETVETPEA